MFNTMTYEVEPTSILYFGYGSNLDNEDWTIWCEKRGDDPSGLIEIGAAWLDGYQLCFDYYSRSRKGGAANLKKTNRKNTATPGALFEIDDYTLDLLDRKEGVNIEDCYQREIVTVYTQDGSSHQAITYTHHSSEDVYYEPTKNYEALIRNNLERLELPSDWLDYAINKSPQPEFNLIFVYGTLMKGMSRHSEIESDCDFLGYGTVKGELYQISDFPGLVPGNQDVYGELYRAKEATGLIKRLDWIEGFIGDYPLFSRVIQRVYSSKEKLWAYTYQYSRPIGDSKLIQSNCWREFE